ncbi:hypothetical protein Q5P01_000188 [Channa striata]|uniref:CCHC-type domain-containing protein n=1 Tax=Channa striata TaxID=64152 RepID=A0AA88LFY1_CHASR|nr:hypothetical protein Q5P01_000188 [Channa striata]
MDVYLHKKGLSGDEQKEEILNHLLGRARSIVKVGLKSNNSPSSEVIYAILRRYFSESPGSSLPLADFYATHPMAKETPVDYWVRLNTAAEAADRHLQRQGSKMDNMDAEIAMMFVRNCPDPSLACVFRCKPISKWSLTEVQEAIDEHQREYQAKRLSIANAHVVQVTPAVASSSSPEPEPVCAHLNTAVCAPANPIKSSEAVVPESNALERVLSMLERVLERTSQVTHATSRPHFSPSARFPQCKVCGDGSHSTRTHCMREKRCLTCLEIGHQRRDCPKITVVQHANSPDQGN